MPEIYDILKMTRILTIFFQKKVCLQFQPIASIQPSHETTNIGRVMYEVMSTHIFSVVIGQPNTLVAFSTGIFPLQIKRPVPMLSRCRLAAEPKTDRS